MIGPLLRLIRNMLIAWLCLTEVGGGAAWAQGTMLERTNNIRASLIAESGVEAGETLYLAIHFEPVGDEWHGYWRNPGDAGYGMELNWSLPPGWEAGEPVYPVPTRLLIGGLMNHVYEGDYTVLIPVRTADDTMDRATATIGLEAQWLACTDTICVPEQAQLRTRVAVGGRVSGGGPTDDSRFTRWQARIAPMLDTSARFERAGDMLRLAIPLPASATLADPHVFVGERDLVAYAQPQRFKRSGDWLIAEIPLIDRALDVDGITGIIAFEDGRGVRFTAKSGPVPQGGTTVTTVTGDAPALTLLILAALAGGLILNVMPCVFPILSLKALSLARAGADETQARREGLAYTAGVVFACLALGGLMLALRAGGEQIGWAFQLQEPAVVVALLILASIITANLAGVFEVPNLPMTRRGEPAGAFATGLLAAVAATPCTGPFMAAALGAALLLPAGAALLLFAALGLGLALPFLAIGLIPALRRRLPKPGAWMDRFRKALAIPMGLTALALMWLTSRLGGVPFALTALMIVVGVVAGLWATGRLQRRGKMAWPAFGLIAAPFAVLGAIALPNLYDDRAMANDASILEPRPFTAAALRDARASGRPVFVWFTADWCVTCKVNERVAIERNATRAAFDEAGVVTLRGDWTRRDPEITRYLDAQGAAGIPLYVWYDGDGRTTVLPQILAPDALVRQARGRR
ncbi:MAG: thioredoxin family protein [Pontixanthobacter sp.]